MTWMLVRKEVNYAMEAAHFEAHAKSEQVFASVPEVWSAMLSASPPPTDYEIDWIYLKFRAHVDRVIAARVTDQDRTRMRQFLTALSKE